VPPPEPPKNGERIGAYRIESRLGQGGMGEVFLAWDDRLRRRVAIKRIRLDGEMTSTLRQRLLREAQSVAGLSHPAIVHIYDLLEDTDGDCIVMEYVQGRTLNQALAGGPLEPAFAVRLAEEVASGLAAAHEAGILHRDLKTENVMITLSGDARILDFGLAKPIGPTSADPSLTAAGFVVGTWRSMSPEQARGAELDERSDLFSFGILLYEMLTGGSPFRGSSPLEILTKVISEHPPCVDTLRPGIPPTLAALVERLLAKEPGARPQSAAEVARELHAIAGLLKAPTGLSSEATVSGLPTDTIKRWPDESSRPVSPSPPRRRRVLEVAVILALSVLLVGAILFQWRATWGRAKLLRVVVPNPEVAGDDAQLQLAATGLLTASLSTLGSLKGVAAVDPAQLVGSPKTPKEMAQAAAADTVLIITLQKDQAGGLGWITLRYVHGSDSRVLWSEWFQASVQSQELRSLAETLDTRLRNHFSDHPPETRSPTLAVGKEDYAAFLEIKQRLNKGQTLAEPELPLLESIAGRSRDFLDVRLLAADVAIGLFQSRRETAYRDRALRLIRQAELLAPGDPGPLKKRFKLELAEGRTEIAAGTLSQLERLAPADPQNLTLRANLAEARGRYEEALAEQRKAVDLLPSWRNLLKLAKLETRSGRVSAARGHLEQILAGSPENIWALQQLAELELNFGDPTSAETIYLQLIQRSPGRDYYINLGVARLLLHHYADAVAAFHQALAIAPDDVEATLNLADAELALEHGDDARALYRKVLQLLERNHPSGDAADNMIKAQCLAHLERTREAVEIVEKALRQNPDNIDILQSAALVHTLAGDPASALMNIKGALDKGVQPRLFQLPSFSPLFKDPEFKRLVEPDGR
jgi:serine/threonine protein kinase/tetratricopeptide (TPR) repeat protein